MPKITNLQKNDIEQFYKFNRIVFPERENIVEIINFWFSKTNDEYLLSKILYRDSNEILGEILHSSMEYFYQNSIWKACWIFDYIVREDIRKEGYGIDLMEEVLKNKNEVPIFATGSGPLALKIELKMGFKLIGELKKYITIINPLYSLTSLFRKNIPLNKFPQKIKVKNQIFSLINKKNLPELAQPFNQDLLEIVHNKDFLNWRFFSNLHNYAFYLKEYGNDYFVIRTIAKKNITCLALVDYRCKIDNPNNFDTIIEATKEIAKRLRIAPIITGSSLQAFDEILEKKHFRTIGRNRPIISSKSFKNEDQRINDRSFIFVTLADSDGEISWK